MGLPFFKMQGCGNDYVYINAMERPVDEAPALARRVADRRFGVGSDGLILLAPPLDGGDVRMVMYNADGSESGMCGNGIRCLAKLAYDLGVCRKRHLKVETGGGLKEVELVLVRGQATGAKVAMGVPSFERAAIPMTGEGEALDAAIEVEGQEVVGCGVGMGNPHFVIFVEDRIDDALVHGLGPKIERSEHFPERVNVEFIQILDRETLRMRVWERGSGETWACGTGASAALAAGVATGRLAATAVCHLKGGALELSWPERDKDLIMTGPATLVFKGELLEH